MNKQNIMNIKVMKKFFKVLFVFFGVLTLVIFGLLHSMKFSPLFASLPSITEDSSGHNGDPINIALVGDKDSITKAFVGAQWIVPDPIDASSTAKIIEASIANSSYPTAPVSNLYLLGRVQDVAFEYPTNSVRKRHHVRLWETKETVSGKDLWIGSATFDSGIELSHTNDLPTHRIDANIDNERNFLSTSLRGTGLIKTSLLERNAYPTLWAFNGGGDWYFDDGNVELLMVK